tara:strand:- start:9329 stop:11116 length:1788 start_codon:yes stop_codon:yes gene_type:complete
MRLSILLFFTVNIAFSQTDKSQLAYQFFQESEYEKAVEIYKSITIGNKIIDYYEYYLQCLIRINNFVEAEKIAKRMVFYSDYLKYNVDLYLIYTKLGDRKNSDKILKDIKRKLEKNPNQVINICNLFIKYSFYQEALDIYMLIEKLFADRNYSYYIQKAQIYQYLGMDELMLNEYFKYLEKNPSQKQYIKNILRRYLENNGLENQKNYNNVKESLLIFSQQETDSYLFSELLIWFFMQHNEFQLAFLQAKALDKRFSEDGERLYNMAETFLDNSYFDLAIKCYDYIIEKGRNTYYYIDAQVNRLYSLEKKEEIDLSSIDESYIKIIDELGKNYRTVILLNNYAYFKAFYMNDLLSSIDILEETMDLNRIDPFDLADCMLVYADVMLLSGNIWTSLLYYSKIEKNHRESPIGHEAKLRKAKISYYQGDFDWAQTQLDILKSSTSKLISNDAMALSLLITDNLNLDTTKIPMEMYARADLLFYQNRFDESIKILDSIIEIYSGHSLMDEIIYRKFEIYKSKKDMDSGIKMLKFIVEDYSYDILLDDALFNLAQIYQKSGDIENSLFYYEKILFECSGSIYTSESRKQYRNLRDDDNL